MTRTAPSANDLACAALRYVIRNGEADPQAPDTADTREAIAEYDGSTESEDVIWNAYYDVYNQ